MDSVIKRNNSVGFNILFLVIIAVIIGVFTYNTVWIGDDITYAFDFREDHNDEIVGSFSQTILSMNEHYLTWNGRYVPHVAVQFFCSREGHLAFAISNALVYILYLLLICRFSGVKPLTTGGLITVSLLVLSTFQTKMTPSCQIGYIWTFSLVLLFLTFFFKKRRYSWWQIVLLVPFSLIAGNGNEALNIGVSCALILYWWRNHKGMTVLQYAMMICFGLGTLIICLSPAAHSRASSVVSFDLINIFSSFRGFFLFQKATFVMLGIIVWKIWREKMSLKTICEDNSFFLHVWVTMMIFNMIIGFWANRPLFGAELAAIIISVNLLKNHSFNKFWMGVFTIYLSWLYVIQAEYVWRVKRMYDDVERQYVESTDGIVFYEADYQNQIPVPMSFSPDLIPYGIRGTRGDYEYSTLDKWLKKRYSRDESLKILPIELKAYLPTEADNQIISLKQPCLYLVIQSKTDPRPLYIDRHINYPFIKKDFELLEIPMTERILY